MANIFIDGSAGTTGLRIRERLSQRRDIALIELPEALRKDKSARADALNAADVAFLCLPDAAAEEAVGLIHGGTAVIDTSTAHRTAEGWTYGFPELAGRRERIAASKRIANPGCHATGFIALTEPLVRRGILSSDAALSCFSLTGYSGGGKQTIADYEAPARDSALDAPRQYGLGQAHKHLPEMAKLAGLTVPPLFCPVVADFYSGMEVTIPLHLSQINGTKEDVIETYQTYYTDGVVRFEPCDTGTMLAANALAGRDNMIVTVAGSGDRLLLVALFDNLGKGASGAAIQNMNILLGVNETEGLIL